MVFENLNVEFTEQCIEEMDEIYEYISTILKEDKATRRQNSSAPTRPMDGYQPSLQFTVKLKKS